MSIQKSQHRNFFNFFIHSRLYLIGGSILVLFMGMAVVRQFTTKHQVDSEIFALKDQIKALEGGNQDLGKLLEYFKSDEFLKQEAKLKFGLKEKGEQVVVLTDRTKQQRKLLAVAQPQDTASNPQKWWRYFFNN